METCDTMLEMSIIIGYNLAYKSSSIEATTYGGELMNPQNNEIYNLGISWESWEFM